VTVDPADPGAAVAFARRGYGVVAPRSSGADEYVRDVATYDVRAPRELYVAVSIALGRPASLRAVPVEPPRAPPLVPLPMPRADAPLVSVVIPTFNRRAQLPAALASLGAQTYPNLEAIVVNDGGANVDDIVAACPFARVHNLPRNGGMNHAMMAGLALARGTFVQFLSDDDRLFPDHVERLVAAMLAAGASVGHGNVMIRYEGQLENGAQVTTGYNVGVFTETATPSEALIATPIAGHALMWRRSVYDEIGPWRDDCALADQEIQLRAAQRYAFVWIDQVTAEWCIRGTDNFSSKVNAADEQKRIYDELHPVPGRPLLALQRERTVENIRRRPPGPVFGPTLTVGSAPPAGVPR
jgi:glycosyltransferase involved in cell wall biosynthesis